MNRDLLKKMKVKNGVNTSHEKVIDEFNNIYIYIYIYIYIQNTLKN